MKLALKKQQKEYYINGKEQDSKWKILVAYPPCEECPEGISKIEIVINKKTNKPRTKNDENLLNKYRHYINNY